MLGFFEALELRDSFLLCVPSPCSESKLEKTRGT